jgi:hypothetical protein
MWGTDEPELDVPDGPVKETKLEDVPKEGAQLIEGFEWVTMDLTDEAQVLLPSGRSTREQCLMR